MRKHTVLMALALVCCLVVWVQIVATQVGANVIPAEVDITPDALLLKTGGCGRWITAHVALPNGYDVEDINMSSVTLRVVGNNVPVSMYRVQGKKLMVKFDRASVIRFLWPTIDHMAPRVKQEVALTVTGKYDGDVFEGSDTIRVFYTHS